MMMKIGLGILSSNENKDDDEDGVLDGDSSYFEAKLDSPLL